MEIPNSNINKFLIFSEMELSSLIFFFYFLGGVFLHSKNEKNTLNKFFIFPEMELSSFKNVMQLSYALNKSPLQWNGYLSNIYLLAARASSFLIHPLSWIQSLWYPTTYCAVYFSNLQDTKLHYWSTSTSHRTLPRKVEDFPIS